MMTQQEGRCLPVKQGGLPGRNEFRQDYDLEVQPPELMVRK